jgi:hypothetical protein
MREGGRQVEHVAWAEHLVVRGRETSQDLERKPAPQREIRLIAVAPAPPPFALQQEDVVRIEMRSDAAAGGGQAHHDVVEPRIRQEREPAQQRIGRRAMQIHALASCARQESGFSILAIFCLTLGLGATAAVYSWLEGILLRPYALVTGQDRMVVLVGKTRGEPGHTVLTWPDFLDVRRNTTLFESVVCDKITGTTLAAGDRAERVSGQVVSANSSGDRRPTVKGRGFEPAERVRAQRPSVVVISFWDVGDRTWAGGSSGGSFAGVAPHDHQRARGFRHFVGYRFGSGPGAGEHSSRGRKSRRAGRPWVERSPRSKPA